MPPLRTFLPAAPVKTERTHEENQERAYIAASRRSDRSLEARVESARRASEIHKRRTGRSLRVTEQDVLNEEMYEEEDDDLPSQYRRLTAHLQTGSADFNRRLAAYLTNHVAMRSALDQAITASYAQEFPNAPRFAHNQPGVFPSPFAEQTTSSASTPISPTSPHPYRHTPYPMPGMRGYRPQEHHRSASISHAQDLEQNVAQEGHADPAAHGLGARRFSVPAPKPSGIIEAGSLDQSPFQHSQIRGGGDTSAERTSTHVPPGFSPFTTSLPPDTQQLVGPALDPADPFTSSLMSGSQATGILGFGRDYDDANPKELDHGFLDGMNSTLAPAPTSSQGAPTAVSHKPAPDDNGSSDYALDFGDLSNETFLPVEGETDGTALTPGADGAWDAFIDDSSWAENAQSG